MWKAQQQLDEPIDVVGTDEVFSLRGSTTESSDSCRLCPHADPRQRDLMVSLGQFLRVVDAPQQRVVPDLAQPRLEQVQDHLRVLGVFLVPGVVRCLAGAGQGQVRNQTQLQALVMKKVSQRSTVVAGRLEGDQSRRIQPVQRHRPVASRRAILNSKPKLQILRPIRIREWPATLFPE